MAEKKNLNNPNKSVKTTSTKSPARSGGEVTKMTGTGKAVSYTNAKGKKEDIAGNSLRPATYLAKDGQARKDGKKFVKSGLAATTGTVASSMTKKGNKVQANKLTRELKKPVKKGK
jgi:hypothetical protein